MFCPICDPEAPARHCSGCGAQLAEPPNEIRLLRPTFVHRAQLLAHLPFFLLAAAASGFLFGGGAAYFIETRGLDIPKGLGFLGFGALFGGLFAWLFLRLDRTLYSATLFRLYPDRLEYTEGLFLQRERTVGLDRVADVRLERDLGQRQAGLATLLLTLDDQDEAGWTEEVRLFDLEGAEELLVLIRRLVAEQRNRRTELRLAS